MALDRLISGLLELDQRAAEVLRVQEEHRLAVRADLRLAVAQDPRALPGQLLARRADVLDLVADVVDAALRIALEEARNGRIGAERLQELDLGVGKLDEDGRHAMLGLRRGVRDLGAEETAIDLRRGLEIRHRDRDVIETADHSVSSGLR